MHTAVLVYKLTESFYFNFFKNEIAVFIWLTDGRIGISEFFWSKMYVAVFV